MVIKGVLVLSRTPFIKWNFSIDKYFEEEVSNLANIRRKLGINIRTCMLEANISLDSFAKHFGYSIKDVWNVIEGKVIIPPAELEKIAGLLKTTKSGLINRESDTLVPDLQYIKEFSNPDNLDRILDLMDEYVELIEVV